MESMSIGIIDMLAVYNCMLCSTPFCILLITSTLQNRGDLFDLFFQVGKHASVCQVSA